jgi:predicted DNA-binding transcriptional regulator YafY
VRFLGRKVYLGAVVILVSAMRQGPTPRRVRELTKLFDVDRRTIYRWRDFWNEHFPKTTFWKVARARLVPVFEIVDFPRSLLEAFVHAGDDRNGWGELLRFLSPITITKGLAINICDDCGQPAEDARRRF